MLDILLLEPTYENKYPPLGLMKISYYHKHVKHDYIKFSKGKLPKEYENKKWDRVYISTLFTYEWDKTIEMIKYGKSVVKNEKNVFAGGVLATLMEDKLKEIIKPVTGLLDIPGKLGYDDDDLENREDIIPDYEMLDTIDYKYPNRDAYFTYTTRGCGMDCDFCAVKRLEPEYKNFISISKEVKKINEEYGPKKDLLLMDNNVLKSCRFDEIVDEIKSLGFEKGAKLNNKLRYVDFNQGLDANFLTEKKAKKLSEISIHPARIAFDHISDKDKYIEVIKRCAKYGIKNLSNYVLYNTDDFNGKAGKSLCADTPEDLYNRLMLTVNLKNKINESQDNNKTKIFSFPMRYIPLDATERGYVGKKWNKKYLRAIQVMLMPTLGKGVSSKSYFLKDFGQDINEYMETLLMPEEIITRRGYFVEKKGETEEEKAIRKKEWDENQQIQIEWKRLYKLICKTIGRDELLNLIAKNKFDIEVFSTIDNVLLKKIYMYYLSKHQFLLLLNELDMKENYSDISLIQNYIKDFPIFKEKIIKYIFSMQVNYKLIKGFINIFGKEGIKSLLNEWINNNFIDNSMFLDRLGNALSISKHRNVLDINKLITLQRFISFNCLGSKELKNAKKYVQGFNEEGIFELIKNNLNKFKRKLNSLDINDLELRKIKIQIIKAITEQLSLFDKKGEY